MDVEHGEIFDEDDGPDGQRPPTGTIELRPNAQHANLRLDRYVTDELRSLSRAYIQGLIDGGAVLVDGIPRRSSFKLTPGEVVSVTVPPVEEFHLEPENIPLQIVFEDEDMIVLDKPAGLVVHPAPGHPRGTLVNALLFHAPQISIAGSNRPGIVHRLDKDTSGLMVVAKTDAAQRSLLEQWASRSVRKGYRTLVAGILEEDEATIDAPIGRDPLQRQRMTAHAKGKPAVTHFTTRERLATTTYADVEIETGRTHQIRVHFAFIGHPVVGDAIYGHDRAAASRRNEPWLNRQFLHAHQLGIRLLDGREVTFESPLPDELTSVLDAERQAAQGWFGEPHVVQSGR
jgi:23S rRNA pseudouridine1911/1915/1917 synthase